MNHRTLKEDAIGFHLEAAPKKGIMADYNRQRPKRTYTRALSPCISIMPDGTRRDMTPERAERKPRQSGNTVTLAMIVQAEMNERKRRLSAIVGNITPTAEQR